MGGSGRAPKKKSGCWSVFHVTSIPCARYDSMSEDLLIERLSESFSLTRIFNILPDDHMT